jgi:hypothetical protein
MKPVLKNPKRPKRKKAGRPPLGENARVLTATVKVSARELWEWRRKAKAEGMPFTRWMLKPRRDLEEGKQ